MIVSMEEDRKAAALGPLIASPFFLHEMNSPQAGVPPFPPSINESHSYLALEAPAQVDVAMTVVPLLQARRCHVCRSNLGVGVANCPQCGAVVSVPGMEAVSAPNLVGFLIAGWAGF
jgi:hypothetical protein